MKNKLASFFIFSLFFSINTNANLLINGDFESTVVPDPPGYDILYTGETTTGWNVIGSVNRSVWIGHRDTPGDNVIDISGQTDLPGSGISQQFSTISGGLYSLSFDVQRFRPNSPSDAVSYFDISVGSLFLDELAIEKLYDLGIHSYQFTALGIVSELIITSGSTDWYDDAYLDDISVTLAQSVPDNVHTFSLLSLTLIGAAAFKRSRKKVQPDV